MGLAQWLKDRRCSLSELTIASIRVWPDLTVTKGSISCANLAGKSQTMDRDLEVEQALESEYFQAAIHLSRPHADPRYTSRRLIAIPNVRCRHSRALQKILSSCLTFSMS